MNYEQPPPTQGLVPPLQDTPLPLLPDTLLRDTLRDTLHSHTKDIQSIPTSPTLVTRTTLQDPLGHIRSSQDTRGTHNHRMEAQCMGNLLKNTVYVVEQGRREDSGDQACLTACWTALCCCCLWDMLT